MLSLSVKNIAREISELERKLDAELSSKFSVKTRELLQSLSDATPVDTGLARDSWGVKLLKNRAFIVNEVEYIDRLNAGHSKQAPAHFIERTALRYGIPIGVIVKVY